MNTSHIKSFPILQFVLAVMLDIAEFSFPIGYIVGLIGDVYLYTWAVAYLGGHEKRDHVKNIKSKTSGSLSRNLFLRIILEAIPLINFLPISTYFVYSVWKERK
jgi:hypothetical protein